VREMRPGLRGVAVRSPSSFYPSPALAPGCIFHVSGNFYELEHPAKTSWPTDNRSSNRDQSLGIVLSSWRAGARLGINVWLLGTPAYLSLLGLQAVAHRAAP
jgi:hypothetical protein